MRMVYSRLILYTVDNVKAYDYRISWLKVKILANISHCLAYKSMVLKLLKDPNHRLCTVPKHMKALQQLGSK